MNVSQASHRRSPRTLHPNKPDEVAEAIVTFEIGSSLSLATCRQQELQGYLMETGGRDPDDLRRKRARLLLRYKPISKKPSTTVTRLPSQNLTGIYGN